MTLGIGNDIIEIERIDTAIKKHGQPFLNRIFTQREQSYCLQHTLTAQHFAGRFAAKEAISKALGLGIGQLLSWLDMEIVNDTSGQPLVIFSHKVYQHLPSLHVKISISHCKKYALATAISLN